MTAGKDANFAAEVPSSHVVTRPSSFAWFNGRIVEREVSAPSVASISFHLGTGVFDGLMAYWNSDHYYLLRAEEHLIRFRNGAARMGLNVPWSVMDLLEGINELLRLEPQGTQYVRPIAYRGGPELWVTGSEGRPIDVAIFTVRTENFRDIDAPITCQISPIERISSLSIPAQTKVSGAYVNSLHARRTAEAAGFQDAIMFDRDGRLAEASAANFFALKHDCLVTPPLNPDVFPGITRSVLIELATEAGMIIREHDLRRYDLKKLDGALLCSTLMEIRGLSQLDETLLPTHELPVFQRLVTAFRALTHQ
jgi:branched-chain amino acid aminotransferase